jgi:hypothetical protein
MGQERKHEYSPITKICTVLSNAYLVVEYLSMCGKRWMQMGKGADFMISQV